MQPSSIDWSKVANAFQAFLTPVLAIAAGILGWATYKIQREQAKIQRQVAEIQWQQAETQRQQAETSDRAFRLSLFEKRMTVFDSTMEFLAGVHKGDAQIKQSQIVDLLRKTRDHEFLFGPEIENFIMEAYKQGNKLRARQAVSADDAELLTWFAEQTAVAKKLFLPYMNFRKS